MKGRGVVEWIMRSSHRDDWECVVDGPPPLDPVKKEVGTGDDALPDPTIRSLVEAIGSSGKTLRRQF